ncbi:hypothetical protein F5883DRAFT_577888 [Diaporthe sp. PMI_573]|nr:hypothetical protein F5883DRAFT_577888 [Diaporthaceae sp. PMI_573]
MAETFDLSSYKCERLPQFLWRVTHSETRSVGHVASHSRRTFRDLNDLKAAVSTHVFWLHQPSCFLSTFSDREHAMRWAKSRARKNTPAVTAPDDQSVKIHKIDTSKLPIGKQVISMDSFKSLLDFTYNYSEHEYLVLHRIPTESIVSVQSLGEMEEEGNLFTEHFTETIPANVS